MFVPCTVKMHNHCHSLRYFLWIKYFLYKQQWLMLSRSCCSATAVHFQLHDTCRAKTVGLKPNRNKLHIYPLLQFIHQLRVSLILDQIINTPCYNTGESKHIGGAGFEPRSSCFTSEQDSSSTSES